MITARTRGLILCATLGALPGAQALGQTVEAPVGTLDRAVAAAERLSAGAAFETALAEAGEGERAAIGGFYAARAWAPYWTEAGPGRVENLLASFADAAFHGLPPARYLVPELQGLLAGDEVARAEVALSQAFLRYARDMTGGLLEPRSVDGEINLVPERQEAAALLARLGETSLLEMLGELLPDSPDYRALMEEKARLEAVARAGGWGERVPGGPALRLGDEDPRVERLRSRLAALGAGVAPGTAPGMARVMPPETAPGIERVMPPGSAPGMAPFPATGAASEPDALAGPARFDQGLEAALKRFQAANGLVDDGILGRETLAQLNASPEERLAQILVNLERLRWQPGDLGERHVLVNIPDYTTSVYEGGARVYHSRAVVGEPLRTRTPEFSDTMTYLVVNPTWYIPDSIAGRVYLPQLRQDPTVLARNNMRLFTRAGTEIDPGLVDFATLGDAFPFRVRQNPSASNALGRVKFMFPNQFAIYLHDTPARELFDRDARAFSNGCVRLEQPFELAHYLLAPQLDDPEAQFRAWVDAGAERYVTLERPIAVHLVYRTAWADEGGVHFRRDVYGRDAKVLEALAAEGVPLPARETAQANGAQAG